MSESDAIELDALIEASRTLNEKASIRIETVGPRPSTLVSVVVMIGGVVEMARSASAPRRIAIRDALAQIRAKSSSSLRAADIEDALREADAQRAAKEGKK